MTTRRRVLSGAAMVVVLAALVACQPSLGRPAVGLKPSAPRVFDNADPAVLVVGSKTYLFGSTNNKKLPVREITSFSTSLADSQTAWARQPLDAMPSRPAWIDPGEWEIWAPSVTKIGTKYVVYFAGRRGGVTYDEDNDQCIGRAVATNPTGPYVPGADPVYCGLPPEGAVGGLPRSNPWGRGALDPEVFRAPGGKLYLIVSLSRTRDNIAAVPLDSAGNVPGGPNARATVLARQSLTWHDGTYDGALGGGAFLENPTMAYDKATKTYLLFYSAGQWYTSRYVTGFARCTSPLGPCALDTRGPFLVQGNGRSGVGALTAFTAADGTQRVAYATWQAGRENQVGGVGEYKRQTHWATLSVTNTSDPSRQTVTLR